MHPICLGLAVLALAAACSPDAERAASPTPPAVAAPLAAAPPSKYKEVESPGAARDAAGAYRSDTVDVLVAPANQAGGGDKLEYKLQMKAGDTLTYAWEAQGAGGVFWHEFHGHTGDTVTFYKKAEGTTHAGVLTAPFEGIHGWYFENRGPTPVVVRLRISGFYALVPDEKT